MIVLFTDFGAEDIYVPQMKATLLRRSPPGAIIVDLLHSVPNFNIRAGAHLLAALQTWFPLGATFLTIVDPGVGSARDPVILEADGRWFVGPDNGLLSVVAARAAKARSWRITWRPDALLASFHGRDLFAPVTAWIAEGNFPVDKAEEIGALNIRLPPDDLAEIIYIDHYGNALTGVRAGKIQPRATIEINGHKLAYSRVFAEAPVGSAFWYENSVGLVEIAVNRGSAAVTLGIEVADSITINE